jgi:hypothetical protein
MDFIEIGCDKKYTVCVESLLPSEENTPTLLPSSDVMTCSEIEDEETKSWDKLDKLET